MPDNVLLNEIKARLQQKSIEEMNPILRNAYIDTMKKEKRRKISLPEIAARSFSLSVRPLTQYLGRTPAYFKEQEQLLSSGLQQRGLSGEIVSGLAQLPAIAAVSRVGGKVLGGAFPALSTSRIAALPLRSQILPLATRGSLVGAGYGGIQAKAAGRPILPEMLQSAALFGALEPAGAIAKGITERIPLPRSPYLRIPARQAIAGTLEAATQPLPTYAIERAAGRPHREALESAKMQTILGGLTGTLIPPTGRTTRIFRLREDTRLPIIVEGEGKVVTFPKDTLLGRERGDLFIPIDQSYKPTEITTEIGRIVGGQIKIPKKVMKTSLEPVYDVPVTAASQLPKEPEKKTITFRGFIQDDGETIKVPFKNTIPESEHEIIIRPSRGKDTAGMFALTLPSGKTTTSKRFNTIEDALMAAIENRIKYVRDRARGYRETVDKTGKVKRTEISISEDAKERYQKELEQLEQIGQVNLQRITPEEVEEQLYTGGRVTAPEIPEYVTAREIPFETPQREGLPESEVLGRTVETGRRLGFFHTQPESVAGGEPLPRTTQEQLRVAIPALRQDMILVDSTGKEWRYQEGNINNHRLVGIDSEGNFTGEELIVTTDRLLNMEARPQRPVGSRQYAVKVRELGTMEIPERRQPVALGAAREYIPEKAVELQERGKGRRAGKPTWVQTAEGIYVPSEEVIGETRDRLIKVGDKFVWESEWANEFTPETVRFLERTRESERGFEEERPATPLLVSERGNPIVEGREIIPPPRGTVGKSRNIGRYFYRGERSITGEPVTFTPETVQWKGTRYPAETPTGDSVRKLTNSIDALRDEATRLESDAAKSTPDTANELMASANEARRMADRLESDLPEPVTRRGTPLFGNIPIPEPIMRFLESIDLGSIAKLTVQKVINAIKSVPEFAKLTANEIKKYATEFVGIVRNISGNIDNLPIVISDWSRRLSDRLGFGMEDSRQTAVGRRQETEDSITSQVEEVILENIEPVISTIPLEVRRRQSESGAILNIFSQLNGLGAVKSVADNFLSGARQRAEELGRRVKEVAPIVNSIFYTHYDKVNDAYNANYRVRKFVDSHNREKNEVILALVGGYLKDPSNPNATVDQMSPFTGNLSGKTVKIDQDTINRAINFKNELDRLVYATLKADNQRISDGLQPLFLPRGTRENYIPLEFREDVNGMIYNLLVIPDTAIVEKTGRIERGGRKSKIAKFEQFIADLTNSAMVYNYQTSRYEPAFSSVDEARKVIDIAASKQLSVNEAYEAVRTNTVDNPKRFGHLEFSRRIEYPGATGWEFIKKYMITDPVVLGEMNFEQGYGRIYSASELGSSLTEFKNRHIQPLIDSGKIDNHQADILTELANLFLEGNKPSNRLLAKFGKDYRALAAASIISSKTAIQQSSEFIKLTTQLLTHPKTQLPAFLNAMYKTGMDYITQNHEFGSYYDIAMKSTLHGIDTAFREGLGKNWVENVSQLAIRVTGVGYLDRFTRIGGAILGAEMTKRFATDLVELRKTGSNPALQAELERNLTHISRLRPEEVELVAKPDNALTNTELELKDRALTKAGLAWQNDLFHSYQDYELPTWWSGQIQIGKNRTGGEKLTSQVAEEVKRSALQLSKFQWQEGQWIRRQYQRQMEAHGSTQGFTEATGIVMLKTLLSAWSAPLFLAAYKWLKQDTKKEKELYNRRWQELSPINSYDNLKKQVEKYGMTDTVFDLFRYNMVTGGLGRTGDTFTRMIIEPEQMFTRRAGGNLGVGGMILSNYATGARDWFKTGDYTKLMRAGIKYNPLQSVSRKAFPVEEVAPTEPEIRERRLPEEYRILQSIESDRSKITQFMNDIGMTEADKSLPEVTKRGKIKGYQTQIDKFQKQLQRRIDRLEMIREGR